MRVVGPRGSSNRATDERVNDVVDWQTRLVLGDGATLEEVGRGPPVTVPSHELGFGCALSMRDPDGHTLEIVER
jgi:hypothetical protein